MGKKIFFIIIGIVGILLIVAGVTYFIKSKNGTITTNTTGEEGKLNFRNFVPFGGNKIPSPDEEEVATIDGTTPDTQPDEQGSLPRLIKVYGEPVSGMIGLTLSRPIPTTEQTSTDTAVPPKVPLVEEVSALRFTDKATGHIYQTFLDKVFPEKISNTTIPRIHQSLFTQKGEGMINRYLSERGDIETYSGTLVKGTDGSYTSQRGDYLPKNIPDLSVAPDMSKIFYLSVLGDGIVGTTALPTGENKVQVFTSPYTEWLSQWVNPKVITLTTKPASRSLGYMYSVDPSTKVTTKILGGINGLTTLTSPDAKHVLYSASSGNSFTINLFNTATRKAVSLGLSTLPEKCVWSVDSKSIYCSVPQSIQGGEYPDVWYQGLVSFDDALWKIDPDNNISELLYDPIEEGTESLDGVSLMLTPKGDYLLFLNKKDDGLWSLKL